MIYKRTIAFKTETKSYKEFFEKLRFYLDYLDQQMRIDYLRKVFKLPEKLEMISDCDMDKVKQKIAIYDLEYDKTKMPIPYRR